MKIEITYGGLFGLVIGFIFFLLGNWDYIDNLDRDFAKFLDGIGLLIMGLGLIVFVIGVIGYFVIEKKKPS